MIKEIRIVGNQKCKIRYDILRYGSNNTDISVHYAEFFELTDEFIATRIRSKAGYSNDCFSYMRNKITSIKDSDFDAVIDQILVEKKLCGY